MRNFKLFLTSILIVVVQITTTAQSVPTYIPSNGLVGWWPFSGNANDYSLNGNNGNVKGPTLTADRNGVQNSAYSFDGVDDYISTGKWLSGRNNNFSISVWINLDSQSISPTDKSIILHRADWGDKAIFWSNTPHSVVASDRNGTPVTGISNIILKRNNWEHLVLVSTSGAIAIYINGKLKNSISRTTQSNWDSLYVGSYFGGNGFDSYQGTINAKLDDIGIWNRSLTFNEIVLINEGCDISVTKNPSNITTQIGNSAIFTIESSFPLSNYQWQTDLGLGFQKISNAGQYSGANNDTLTISNTSLTNNNQQFRCIVSTGSCSDTSNTVTLKVNNNASIKDYTLKDNLVIFPIPTNNEITINNNEQFVGSVYIVSNNLGQTVVSGIMTKEKTVVSLSNLSDGIYFLKIGEQNLRIFKVIKLN